MRTLRQTLQERTAGEPPSIRWRGHEVSRLEGLTDAVFAFAITLLVVSLEVPRDFGQLLATMQGFGAFAASFAILAGIWYLHYKFFREYGLVDGTVIVLNLILLFVILFYTFPLKFLFDVLINSLLIEGTLGIPMGSEIGIDWHQMQSLMLVYGVGFLLVFLVFTLLHLHAYRRRELLGLDVSEVYQTWSGVQANLLCVGVAATSIAIVLAGGPSATPLSGWMYALLGPLQGVHAWVRGRGAKRISASVTA
jgi:hypothetical protein